MESKAAPAPTSQQHSTGDPLGMLCVVAPWEMKEKLLKALFAQGCAMLRIMHGKGSYRPYNNLLDFIPASNPEKAVILALCRVKNLANVYGYLNERFAFDKPDAGIAFSMDVNEVIRQEQGKQPFLEKLDREKEPINMKLLYVIVTDGFSGDVLTLLDGAGARGATILPARGWSGAGTVLGVNKTGKRNQSI